MKVIKSHALQKRPVDIKKKDSVFFHGTAIDHK